MKCTAIAPSNIAFIKYWGRKNETLRLPSNGSISMNLSGLITTTTVEFSKAYSEDQVTIDEIVQSKEKALKISKHLDRVRELAKTDLKAKIVSQNTFPQGTGLSSSASGFAALTVAASNATGLKLSEKELSILARQGSGSACRSIPDGFVEWLDGDTSETSYAKSIYPPDYWDIVDVVCILTDQIKDVSTSEGQLSANTSPFFTFRQQQMKKKIVKLKKALEEKDFRTFGETTETEALELHAIMLTSHPSLIYWHPETVTLMKLVKQWRNKGLPVYFSLNTGQNIHLICQKENAQKISNEVAKHLGNKKIILNSPSPGAHLINTDLF